MPQLTVRTQGSRVRVEQHGSPQVNCQSVVVLNVPLRPTTRGTLAMLGSGSKDTCWLIAVWLANASMVVGYSWKIPFANGQVNNLYLLDSSSAPHSMADAHRIG